MTLNMCLGSLYFGCNISTYNSAIEGISIKLFNYSIFNLWFFDLALLTLNKWRNTD